MKKSLLIALPLVGAVMFSGCATILSGKNTKNKCNEYSIENGSYIR